MDITGFKSSSDPDPMCQQESCADLGGRHDVVMLKFVHSKFVIDFAVYQRSERGSHRLTVENGCSAPIRATDTAAVDSVEAARRVSGPALARAAPRRWEAAAS